MTTLENSPVLDLLAAMSHTAGFAIGCCVAKEAHRHRSVSRRLPEERGAKLS